MSAANIRKVLLFGLLGAAGCLVGWVVGEGFLLAVLPANEEAGATLASKPELPSLASRSASAAPPAAPAALASSGPLAPPPAPLPPLTAGAALVPQAPPPPALTLVGKSAAPAPPPPEFAMRLEKAGAKSGDVQITLIWSNVNDLDLHCIDPNGEEVFYGRRRVGSGGELDVDMNGSGPETNRPVENIYWPKGKAPPGKYRVFINHYANHGGGDPTGYMVNVLAGGKRQEFSGKISRGEPRRLIYEFDLKPGGGDPELQVAVSPELVVNPGTKNVLTVRVARGGFEGPVGLRLEGDLRGIAPKEFTIPAAQSEAKIEISADPTAMAGERVLGVTATAGMLKANSSFRLKVNAAPAELRLAVSPELIVHQGGKNHLTVRVARAGFAGPVNLRIEGDLGGLTAPVFSVAADASEATTEITAAASASLGDRTLVVKAHAGGHAAEASCRLWVQEPPVELRLAVSPEVIVHPGEKNQLKVRIARVNFKDAVTVFFEGDRPGLAMEPFVIAADENEATTDIAADATAALGERFFKVLASGGDRVTGASVKVAVMTPRPGLRLAAPAEMSINLGGTNHLPIRIARDGFTGPVIVRLSGAVEGLSPREVTIPEDRSQDELALTASEGAAEGLREIEVTASGGGASAQSKLRLSVTATAASAAPQWSWWLVLVIGLWTALLALGLSLALVMGQNWYMARPLLSVGQGCLLLAGALAAGVIAGGVGQTLYGALNAARLLPQIGFLAGWLLLGGLLGRGVVFFIPNLNPWRATIAGACGGLLGAAAFIAVSAIGDLAGRFIGAVILGFAIGLMVAIVEMACRKIWIDVVAGRHIYSVNLGATPVVIGGDGRKCTVRVAGAPGMALKFWEKDGQVYCLDVLAEHTYPVSPGYRHPLKKVEVVVCSNDKGQKQISSPPSRPKRPAPPAAAPTVKVAVPPVPPPVPSLAGPRPRPEAKPPTPPILKPQPAPPAAGPVKPVSPARQAEPPPETAPCPMCGKPRTGIRGKRRCTDCFTMF